MEGGQSCTGGLIDHVLHNHSAFGQLEVEAAKTGDSVYRVLEETLENIAKDQKLPDVTFLTRNLHIWPDFHGNRSPLADPTLTGVIVGLTLQSDINSLAIMYLATIQAISYGTRHIIDTLIQKGHTVNSVTICGGLANSALYLRTQADVLSMQVVVPKEQQSVLLGAAMLGMAASSQSGDLQQVVKRINGGADVVEPREKTRNYHRAKYDVFKEMVKDQIKYKALMENS